ncbi:MAG: DUF6799 domain-containing protein [Ginsengibacter sp.]
MKKIFLAVSIAALLTACNSQGSQTDATTSNTDTTDRSMMSTTAYIPTEGDATFKDQTLMIYKGDKWVATDKEMTMGNGVIVYTNGTVKNGEITDTLAEGEIVSHSGDLYDKAGNAIHDAWDATKKGVNDAGDAVEEGVNKAGNAASKGFSSAGQAANKEVKVVKDAMEKK